MVDLKAIQAEQIVWSERNFGKQHARYPLIGILEELGELGVAFNKDDRPEVLDAVGDVGIYALDFCGKKGWSLSDFWEARKWFDAEEDHSWHTMHIFQLTKKLAHHQLKGEQGIRGGAEHHDEQMKITLCALMWAMGNICENHLGTSFLEVINKVWAKVRLRDWTKNKANAHQVAEQQVIDMTNAARSTDP